MLNDKANNFDFQFTAIKEISNADKLVFSNYLNNRLASKNKIGNYAFTKIS